MVTVPRKDGGWFSPQLNLLNSVLQEHYWTSICNKSALGETPVLSCRILNIYILKGQDLITYCFTKNIISKTGFFLNCDVSQYKYSF